MTQYYSNTTRHVAPNEDSAGMIGAIRAVDRFRFQSKASAHAAEQFKKWAGRQLLPISSAWEAGGDDANPDDVGHGYVVELSANDLIEVGKRAKNIAERHHTYYRVDRLADNQYLVYFTDNPAGLAVATATAGGLVLHNDALGSLMDRWESATKGEGKIRRLQSRIQRMEERLAKARQELCSLDPDSCPMEGASGLSYIGEAGRMGRGGARRSGGSRGSAFSRGRSSTSRSGFARSSREALQIPSSSRLNAQSSSYSPTSSTSTSSSPFTRPKSTRPGQSGQGYGQGSYGNQGSSGSENGRPSVIYVNQQPSLIPIPEPEPQVIVVRQEGPSEDDIYERERLLGYLEEEERIAREQPQVIVVPTEGVGGVKQRLRAEAEAAHDIASRVAHLIPGARYQDFDPPRVTFREFRRDEIQEALNEPQVLRALAGTPYQLKGRLDEMYIELGPQAQTHVGGTLNRVASLGGARGSDFLPDLPYGDVWTDVQYPGFGG